MKNIHVCIHAYAHTQGKPHTREHSVQISKCFGLWCLGFRVSGVAEKRHATGAQRPTAGWNRSRWRTRHTHDGATWRWQQRPDSRRDVGHGHLADSLPPPPQQPLLVKGYVHLPSNDFLFFVFCPRMKFFWWFKLSKTNVY